MGTDENKAIIRHQFELLSAGDIPGAAKLWAAESYNHGMKVDPAGIATIYESLHTVRETHTLHEMIADGDWVAVRTTCHGTHLGVPAFPINGGIFVGIEPTGREYTVQHIHFFRIAGGKIVEHWANRDDLAAARQIGLDLKPDAASSV